DIPGRRYGRGPSQAGRRDRRGAGRAPVHGDAWHPQAWQRDCYFCRAWRLQDGRQDARRSDVLDSRHAVGGLAGTLMRESARRWFARHTHHYDDFSTDRLVALKDQNGSTVSVVLPARNEEATIGSIVRSIRAELVDGCGLVDDLVVIDSHSED